MEEVSRSLIVDNISGFSSNLIGIIGSKAPVRCIIKEERGKSRVRSSTENQELPPMRGNKDKRVNIPTSSLKRINKFEVLKKDKSRSASLSIRSISGGSTDTQDSSDKPDKIFPMEVYEEAKNVTITANIMSQRKWLDMHRWFSLSRPQYSKTCGISSLCSCWNYLFSTLGSGQLKPISQEKVMEVLGFKPPYKYPFGSFTGNNTLLQWFSKLNKYYGVKGYARIYWKMHGKGRTFGVNQKEALVNIKRDLHNPQKAFIYHCYNHYCVPLGYEECPNNPHECYKEINKGNKCVENWLIIGEISKKYPIFHLKKWEEIVTDISCSLPQYYNIRKPDLGVMRKTDPIYTTGRKKGTQSHCFLLFERS